MTKLPVFSRDLRCLEEQVAFNLSHILLVVNSNMLSLNPQNVANPIFTNNTSGVLTKRVENMS